MALKRSQTILRGIVHGRLPLTRDRRVKVSMRVSLKIDSGHTALAIVDDLSKDGFRMRSRALFHPGQRFRMHMPRDTADCEIRWADGLEAGGVFLQRAPAPKW